uniref:RNA-binding protein, putative n=1 Tax=Entamoeba histolytica TaxID=5759 RepID=A0A060N555_ENTHI|nr:RNA-binding protein, putative [Entamoeba histolytica]
MSSETTPNNILVTNIDPSVTVEALTTFFSFTGNVTQVRLSDCPGGTKQAIVSFDSPESVKTAELMTGATLESRRINIESTSMTESSSHDRVFKGEDLPNRSIPELPKEHTKTSVAASLLAQGYILANDTFQKAVQFDREHNITSSIKSGAEKVKQAAISVDENYHITEYLALGATLAVSYVENINDKYKVTKTISNKAQEVDEALNISGAIGTARQQINNGIAAVVTSQPVVSVRNAVNNTVSGFAQNVSDEIAIQNNMHRITQEQVKPEETTPFVVEEQETAPITTTTEETIKPEIQQNELTVPPIDNYDIVTLEDDNTTKEQQNQTKQEATTLIL